MVTNYNLIEKELNQKKDFFTKEIWNLECNIDLHIRKLPLGRYASIEFNTVRIKGGNTTYTPISISVSKYLVKYGNELTINSILIHELTHWFCMVNGKEPYDYSKDFKKECKRVSPKVVTNDNVHVFGVRYVYYCSKCRIISHYMWTKEAPSEGCCDSYNCECKAKLNVKKVRVIDDFKGDKFLRQLSEKFRKRKDSEYYG